MGINDFLGKTVTKYWCNSISLEDISEGLSYFSGECSITIPDSDKLTTFCADIVTSEGPKTIIVLDNYGNELLTREIEERLGLGVGYTIGVDLSEGYIWFVSVNEEDGFYFGRWPIKLPKTYLERVGELASKKRPFHITIDSAALINFIDREYGWKDLEQHLRFVFDFRGADVGCFLKVALFGNDSAYQEISGWRDC